MATVPNVASAIRELDQHRQITNRQIKMNLLEDKQRISVYLGYKMYYFSIFLLL